MTKNMKKTQETTKAISKKRMDSDFKTRLISAIFIMLFIILDISLSAIYTHTELPYKQIAGWFNWGFTILLLSAAMYELTKVMKLAQKSNWLYVASIGMGILFFIFPLEGIDNQPLYQYLSLDTWDHWYVILLFAVVMIGLVLAFGWFTTKSWKQAFIFLAFASIISLGFRGFSIIALYINQGNEGQIGDGQGRIGFNTLIFVWGTILLTDTFAYLGGRRFGKHKMAPKVSPNKTWEGAITGTCVAVGVATIYGCLFHYLLPTFSPFYSQMLKLDSIWVGLPGIMLFVIALLASIVGQLGDLLFSSLKRMEKVKDYSKLIPGHGGILDRLDSFVVVFTLMYFIILGA